MSTIQPLIDQLVKFVNPKIAGTLQEQFGLDSTAAAEAVPTVARPILDGLQERVENPERNVSVLANLYQLLTDESRPTDPEAAGSLSAGGKTKGVVEELLGGPIDGLADHVAAQLGIEKQTARSVVDFVVPKVFAYFRNQTQSEGLEAMVEPLLDEESSAKVKSILSLVKGADNLGNVMKGLGGLFGR